ncbi:MAG: MerR family transcriptional regulator [Micavibrio sp.]|nr:MerR family transcriptional regulator [Micavibrio sp.]
MADTTERVVKISGLNQSKDKKAPGAFRTISEVADELNVAQHVLRFWETKFSQIKPLKRGGGRRYYRPEDVALLKHIHYLLYSEGFTIKGVQKLFKGSSKNQIVQSLVEKGSIEATPHEYDYTSEDVTAPEETVNSSKQGLSTKQRSILEAMLGELKEMRNIIKS